VLAHPNRVVRAEDFRATMRRGKRVTMEHAVVYVTQRAGSEPARFGFVVAKTVGKAVTRNLMRRRLRSLGHELIAQGFSGTDVVVRPLAGSEKLSWSSLHEEIITGIQRGARQ
jgi:ribonuclease P protein component